MDFIAPLDSVKNQILKDIIQHGAISTNKKVSDLSLLVKPILF